jgi:hypothetical protein
MIHNKLFFQKKKSVMSSAAEVEIGALFMNAKAIIPLRIKCDELGHKQPATPMKIDNNTAEGIMNGTIKQNRSKAIDMSFYWLKDRVKQGQLRIYWEPGHKNLANYCTKHHPPCHHKTVRPVDTYTEQSPVSLQGCIELLSCHLAKISERIHGAGIDLSIRHRHRCKGLLVLGERQIPAQLSPIQSVEQSSAIQPTIQLPKQ